ncbi:hypothetical protein [Chromohalobacter sp. 296-RDG]|uniref:hypothetical protein n=1 Tax=Chromohalobacter sp. 296-RDG TaxID=2994062 RepID=UPI002469A872|nr:hypothetical protein [Chromohalobacter sp. 296-RDG]
MFSKDQQQGRVVCLADYGRIKAGAIVPESNELYADVEAWLAEGNTLAAFDGYPELPMNEEQLQDWRESAVISRMQAEIQLHREGLLEQLETIIADPDTDLESVIAWQKSTEVRRNSSTVATLSEQMELTDERLDQMFQQAAMIEA